MANCCCAEVVVSSGGEEKYGVEIHSVPAGGALREEARCDLRGELCAGWAGVRRMGSQARRSGSVAALVRLCLGVSRRKKKRVLTVGGHSSIPPTLKLTHGLVWPEDPTITAAPLSQLRVLTMMHCSRWLEAALRLPPPTYAYTWVPFAPTAVVVTSKVASRSVLHDRLHQEDPAMFTASALCILDIRRKDVSPVALRTTHERATSARTIGSPSSTRLSPRCGHPGTPAR